MPRSRFYGIIKLRKKLTTYSLKARGQGYFFGGLVIKIKKVLIIRVISLFVIVVFLSSSPTYSLPTNSPSQLRVRVDDPQDDERMQRAAAWFSGIDAHLEYNEGAVTGITHKAKDGQVNTVLLDPAPVFNFTLAEKIRNRYEENSPLQDSEGMLASQVYRLRELLGEVEGIEAKSIEELIEMVKEENTIALVALELKGAMFSTLDQEPGPLEEEIRGAYEAVMAGNFGNADGSVQLIMIDLLREESKHIATARIVLGKLIKHYGDNTPEGEDLSSVASIVKISKDTDEMRKRLRSEISVVWSPLLAYVLLADWIVINSRYPERYEKAMDRVIKELKRGNRVFKSRVLHEDKEDAIPFYVDNGIFFGMEKIRIDFNTGIRISRLTGVLLPYHDYEASTERPYKGEPKIKDIPNSIFVLFERIMLSRKVAAGTYDPTQVEEILKVLLEAQNIRVTEEGLHPGKLVDRIPERQISREQFEEAVSKARKILVRYPQFRIIYTPANFSEQGDLDQREMASKFRRDRTATIPLSLRPSREGFVIRTPSGIRIVSAGEKKGGVLKGLFGLRRNPSQSNI